ncbi:MAG: hypothetical protein A2248_08925 [Candidatus Raymondbacteria bacterium RIFOXYA2_FULL_49_16]|nr:MAG: hypothetical protein A2248_08925 [Candidatus Raymondbacteria bacterium RIFOXYA2_FULL_49_16]OGP45606.1 MAG: hypothetical protein A2324_04525 [Candidatus Raymondbacteria bacterium RIFOXYB2_FULL_49_35]
MKKMLFVFVLVLLGQQGLTAGGITSGITIGTEYFLTDHGNYFNPGVGAGYRLRLGLGENMKWQLGGDINANYFINKEGVEGLFVGVPLKLSISRKFTIGSFTVCPGYAAGGYFSIFKDDAFDIFGKAMDVIPISPYLELGKTLKNNSQILLIVGYDIIIEMAENGGLPMFLTGKIGYTF